MRAATTKITHLLFEKDLLKTLNEMCDFIYNDLYDGNGRKTPKYAKIQKLKKKEKKKFPFGCPVCKNGKTPKTSRTYPRWDSDPSLVGQINTGQIKAGNYIFIHMNFQDLQQKRAGVQVEVQKYGDGEDLEN